MYKITEYSYKKAKELGVEIKPSTHKGKKIDVSKNGKFICAIGEINYFDYPTFIQKYGLEYANNKRRLYKLRHKNDNGLAGYYANKILW
jgi:hypothetical protein